MYSPLNSTCLTRKFHNCHQANRYSLWWWEVIVISECNLMAAAALCQKVLSYFIQRSIKNNNESIHLSTMLNNWESAKPSLYSKLALFKTSQQILKVQSNLTLKTVKTRTSLALRTRSQMTNLANLALRTVKIKTIWHWEPKWQWPKMFLKSSLTVLCSKAT